jgi:hypothetical protein
MSGAGGVAGQFSPLAASATVLMAGPQHSSEANPGISQSVHNVREEVAEDDQGSRDEIDGHDDGIVPCPERLDRQQANARPLEDLLRHNRAAEDPTQTKPEPGNYRQEAIARRVAHHDQSLW